jgi:hypothetical protein
MKTILVVAMSLMAIFGCRVEKDIQVEMVRAELIKIDTVFRSPKTLQLLTWKDRDDVRYISYESLERSFIVGTSMLVMRYK